MYLKYWYEDELNKFSEIDKRGSKWIYLTSREFERVFGFKEKTVVLTTMELTIREVIAKHKGLERRQC